MYKKRGRPFGGFAWLVNDKFTINNSCRFNRHVSMIDISINEQSIIIVGVWLPFDKNTNESFFEFNQCLSMIDSVLMNFINKPIILVGDWNSDLTRWRRFDNELRIFVEENDLLVTNFTNFDQNMPTYHNGQYESRIDYIFCNDVAKTWFKNTNIIDEALNLSDHKPLSLECSVPPNVNPLLSSKKNVHRFPWHRLDFVEKCLLL
jgi:exonuclease III